MSTPSAISAPSHGVSGKLFIAAAALLALLVFVAIRGLGGGYYFVAAFSILQYMVLATAWNILGGYAGYINFGSAAFFSIGAYSSVFFYKYLGVQTLGALSLGLMTVDAPYVPYLITAFALVMGAALAGLVGLGTGYLSLRLRGVFFAISTLALAVVFQTIVVNWSYVGGARGAYVMKPKVIAGFANGTEFTFAAMLALTVLAVAIARHLENSRTGAGLEAIRDDELSAETAGVPTLRLKLIATSLSGALMGAAGSLFPFFVTYVDPVGAFSLVHTVNSIAMPLIGGMTSWLGPVLGALLLGTVQQYFNTNSFITPELGLLFVGVLMMVFVAVAPNGILGLLERHGMRKKKQ